jgi:hypothetical protein
MSYWNACQNKNMKFEATRGDLTATGQAYSPMVRPKSAPPYPSVTGVFLEGEVNQWILVNLSAKPLTLRYPGMGVGTIVADRLWPRVR